LYDDPGTVTKNRTVQVVDFCSLTSLPDNLHTQSKILSVGLFGGETFTDGCGNTAETQWHNPCWELYYNSTLVGRCIWDLGHNVFQVEYTSKDAHGIERITTTFHSSKNNSTSDGEGCEDYYCWVCSKYNAFAGNFFPDYKEWRGRDTSFPGNLYKSPGLECPGSPSDNPDTHHFNISNW
jgi:hypothetical protein